MLSRGFRIPVKISERIEHLFNLSQCESQAEFATGQRFVIPGRVSTVFGRLRDKAGLQHGTFHCLRHTAASRMLRAGEPLDKVQYILGHKNILTTRIYIHSSEDSQKAALALDNL